MEDLQTQLGIESLSDGDVLEEAARRLQRQFEKEHGQQLMYGTFRFVFHDGRFQGVEDWPRNKSYLSPSRKSGVSGASKD